MAISRRARSRNGQPRKMRGAVFGDDDVDVAARRRHRTAIERRDDARVPAVGVVDGNAMIERPPGDADAGAHEIDLAADRAEVAVAGDFGIGLSRQVDLDRGVDRVEPRQRRR